MTLSIKRRTNLERFLIPKFWNLVPLTFPTTPPQPTPKKKNAEDKAEKMTSDFPRHKVV
jgi:hypothetical protein